MRVSRSKIRKMIKEDFAQNEMNQRLSSQITMTLDDLIKVVRSLINPICFTFLTYITCLHTSVLPWHYNPPW